LGEKIFPRTVGGLDGMVELSLFNEQASLSDKQFGFNRMFAEYHTAADISYAGV
jgi:hypothetical protein